MITGIAALARWGLVMFKRVAVTISALAFVTVGLALGPGVPNVLARVGTAATHNDANLRQSLAQQSCAAFEAWFLDRACRQPHTKKIARIKKHVARN